MKEHGDFFCGYADEGDYTYVYEFGCMQFWLGDYETDKVMYADGSIDGWMYYTDSWSVENSSTGVRPLLIVQKNQN